MSGAKIHGGEFDGHSDKGAFFKFKSSEDANKFKRHVDSCPNKTCSADLLEEVEHLDELSKDTLQSYFDKSIERRRQIRKQHSTGELGSDDWHNERSKRAKGTRTAFRKMYPEQVEELDELDTKTLMSYANKSRTAIATRNLPTNTLSGPELAKRAAGNLRAIRHIVAKNPKMFRQEEVEPLDELDTKTLKSYAKKSSNWIMKSADKNEPPEKVGKRLSSNIKAMKKIYDREPYDRGTASKNVFRKWGKTEEVEPLDEISRDKVERYISKVGDDQEKKHGVHRDMYSKLDPKRQKGVDRALDRLGTKEKEGIDENKKQMSKSARMIKSLYKHHRMAKEDESVSSYGKKPKISNIGTEKSATQVKPEASIVVSGGKTQTGAKRDTIEIDPMMKRPNQPDPNKKDET
jgi:hypothetical protein